MIFFHTMDMSMPLCNQIGSFSAQSQHLHPHPTHPHPHPTHPQSLPPSERPRLGNILTKFDTNEPISASERVCISPATPERRRNSRHISFADSWSPIKINPDKPNSLITSPMMLSPAVLSPPMSATSTPRTDEDIADVVSHWMTNEFTS